MWRRKSMLAAAEASGVSAMKTTGAMKPTASVKSTGTIEVVAIGENSAVGNVAVVVEENSMTTPVVTPVSPAPAKSVKEADPKAEAKRDSRAANVESRIRIPARPNSDGPSIHEPRVILRHVNNLRIGGLYHNGLPLLTYFLLRCAFQVARLLRTVAHYLNSIHHVLLLIDVSIAEGRGPRQIFVHVGEHRRKFHEGLHTGIPGLRVDFFAELFALKIAMLLQPPVCFHNLIGIGRRCEDLCHQRIGIQCDRRDELLQLFRRLRRSLDR